VSSADHKAPDYLITKLWIFESQYDLTRFN